MSGTGKWREPGVPHRGWSCIGIEDLGEPDHVCEMCEVMPVRYIHAMEHPEYDDVLNVGCVCAGNMEQDYEGARQRERDFKKRQSRRKRWILREWRVSMSGNEFINTDGFNIVVFARGSSWSARVKRQDNGLQRFLQSRYPTADAAKLAAFDAMIG